MTRKVQGYAIGTSGLLTRHVLTLYTRVLVGSWKRADGTRGENYAWYAEYHTTCVGVPGIGYALVAEKDMVRIGLALVERNDTRKAKVAA